MACYFTREGPAVSELRSRFTRTLSEFSLLGVTKLTSISSRGSGAFTQCTPKGSSFHTFFNRPLLHNCENTWYFFMYLARFTPKSGADWYRDVTKIWLRKKTLVIRKLLSPRGPGVGLKEDKHSLYPFFKTVHVKLAVKSFLCTPSTPSMKKLRDSESCS